MRSKHSAKAASAASCNSQISPIAAGSAACVSAATDRGPTADGPAALGLLDTIRVYQLGMQLFNQAEDIVPASIYEGPHDLLKAWAAPASSRAEALEALRLADKACDDGDDKLSAAMVRAARLFFDKEEDLPSGRSGSVRVHEIVGTCRELDYIIGALSSMKISLPALSERHERTPWGEWCIAAENTVHDILVRLESASDDLYDMGLRFGRS